MNARNRPKTSARSKATIFARAFWRCENCGSPGHEKNPLTIEHIVPLSRGGTNKMDNKGCWCADCNKRKGNLLPAEMATAERVW